MPEAVPDLPAFTLVTLGRVALMRRCPDGAEETALGPGKQLFVLVALACAPRRTLPRPSLLSLLWEDVPEDRGRQTLRQTLHQLRRRLGTEVIQANGDDLTLQLSLAFDRERFLAAVEAGDLAAAVRAWPGDFLPEDAVPGGARFEQWADLERRRLRAAFTAAATSRVRTLVDQDHWRDALALAVRLRDADPDDQAGWRVLLQTALATGDSLRVEMEAAALRERLLQEGDRLDPATAALLGQIDATSAEGVTGPGTELPEPPMVGREAAFGAILHAWEHASHGQTWRVAVLGAAGLGKSRLLRAIRDRLQPGHVTVLLVRALPAARDFPLSFVADVAAALGKLRGATGIPTGAARVLVALAPALENVFTGVKPQHPPAESGTVLVQAIGELMAAVAEERPVALLLDDLHWADAGSLRILAAVAERLERTPVLLVASTRAVAAPFACDATMTLDALNEPQIEELLGSLGELDDVPAELLVRGLRDASHGSPLVLLEALLLLSDKGLLILREGHWQMPRPGELWQRLAEGGVLERRLGGLEVEARRVLATLALHGAVVDRNMLVAATGIPESSLDIHLLALEVGGFVARLGPGWGPVHDLQAEALMASLSQAERAERRLALGRALAGRSDASSADLLSAGRHLASGGGFGDAALAFRRWIVTRDGYQRRRLGDLATEFLGPATEVIHAERLVAGLPASVRILHGRNRTWLLAGIVASLLLLAYLLRPPPVPGALRVPNLAGRSIIVDDSTYRFPSLVVEVHGVDGRIATRADVEVRAVLDGEGLTATGPTAVRTHNGLAVFDGLVVRGGGIGTLRFTAAGVPAALGPRVFLGSRGQSLRLLGGTLAGQALDPASPLIRVRPGQPITGDFLGHFRVNYYAAAVLFGVVPSWEPREETYAVLRSLPASADTILRVVVDSAAARPSRRIVAPSQPGRYTLLFVFGAETEFKYIASGTNWTLGVPRWHDGNDLMELPAETLARIREDGYWRPRWRRSMAPQWYGDLLAGAVVDVEVVPD